MMEHSPEEATGALQELEACAHAVEPEHPFSAQLIRRAATSLTDELQRLRGERDAYREAAQDANSDAADAWLKVDAGEIRLAQAQSENTELRAALERIADPDGTFMSWEVARTALQQGESADV